MEKNIFPMNFSLKKNIESILVTGKPLSLKGLMKIGSSKLGLTLHHCLPSSFKWYTGEGWKGCILGVSTGGPWWNHNSLLGHYLRKGPFCRGLTYQLKLQTERKKLQSTCSNHPRAPLFTRAFQQPEQDQILSWHSCTSTIKNSDLFKN